MTIVEAVKALTEGKKIRRNDWEKDHYITLEDNQVVSERGWVSGLCIDDFSANWWEEYKEPVLDEKEKEYLENVLKPFKDRVKYVNKLETYWVDNGEFIFISLGDNIHEHISLPCFPKGSMYKGMETGKKYTLEELGL
jgi:hypothetical protein